MAFICEGNDGGIAGLDYNGATAVDIVISLPSNGCGANLMLKVLISSAASDRLSAAAQFLSRFSNSAEIFVIGTTRAAADDFARHCARLQGATFGIRRFSLVQLAAHISTFRLAANGQAPCSALGTEATVVRAVHDAYSHGSLQYFSPVALLPGFAKAVRATASELRAAGIAASNLESLPAPPPM